MPSFVLFYFRCCTNRINIFTIICKWIISKRKYFDIFFFVIFGRFPLKIYCFRIFVWEFSETRSTSRWRLNTTGRRQCRWLTVVRLLAQYVIGFHKSSHSGRRRRLKAIENARLSSPRVCVLLSAVIRLCSLQSDWNLLQCESVCEWEFFMGSEVCSSSAMLWGTSSDRRMWSGWRQKFKHKHLSR